MPRRRENNLIDDDLACCHDWHSHFGLAASSRPAHGTGNMLDDDVRALAREKNFAAFTTLFADGSPQTHIMWVDADEEYVYINTEQSRQKVRNVAGDPRVVVTIFDAADPYHYVEVRGVVVGVVGG